MGGPAFDCMRNPLGAVRIMFDKAVCGGADASKLGRSDWGATDLFRKFIFEDGALSQVPELNSVSLDSIQPNSLIRFRGMVQDMFDTEYYVGAFKDGSTWRTNKYTDVASVQMPPDSQMQVWDRRLLYCVPIPGQNEWVRRSYRVGASNGVEGNCTMQHREKRQRESCSMAMETDGGNFESDVSNDVKREVISVANICWKTVFRNQPEECLHASILVCRVINLPFAPQRKEGTSGQTMETLMNSKSNGIELDLNMPLGETTFLPCLVKMYDGLDADLKLNDIVEFIGVFTFDPELSVHINAEEAVANPLVDEDISSLLPASKVPRLHCITYQKLSTHNLVSPCQNLELSPNAIGVLREPLLHSLTAVLGGDSLAAQYLLLHILSKVYARVEPVAVGKLSLNLTGFDKGTNVHLFAKTLTEAIQNLLPCSHFMPLTLEYLNKTSVAPRKSYQTNRLMTGALQLAPGTHLTIDETQLKAGTLNSVGVQNVQIFRSLLEWQKVEYDFEYYKMDMPADVQVLILSDGKSNIFPADIVVPFRPTSDSAPLSASQPNLQEWRLYLSAVKSFDHTIGAEMQQVVEDDLVAARREDRSIGTEVFSRWLTMARLVSLSFGDKALSLHHWQMIKDLERRRAERLRCV